MEGFFWTVSCLAGGNAKYGDALLQELKSALDGIDKIK